MFSIFNRLGLFQQNQTEHLYQIRCFPEPSIYGNRNMCDDSENNNASHDYRIFHDLLMGIQNNISQNLGQGMIAIIASLMAPNAGEVSEESQAIRTSIDSIVDNSQNLGDVLEGLVDTM